MPRLLTCLLIASTLTPLVCAQKFEEVPDTAPSLDAPREKALQGTSKEGKPYWYRLPKTIEERRPPALILMLHGTGGSRGWAFWNYGIAGGSFRKDDIVVSPTGMTPGNGKTFNFVQGPQDGEQLAGIIKEFRRIFPINKVFVYGHSQGAFFSYWFAGSYPELVDGIVAHAGNVLQVPHPKLAKDKVAVAILHGEADAVVPVSCAHRTHKIYAEQGYKKLKLEIVEGLNAQTGHWPLPTQVKALFEWLDQVSADSARAAADIVLHQLHGTAVDLQVLVESSQKLSRLAKSDRSEDKEALQALAAATEALLTDLATVHAEALSAEEAPAAPLTPDALAQFRLLHPHFADQKVWKKLLRKAVSAAKRDQRAVERALGPLEAGLTPKSFKAASACLEKNRTAPDLTLLARQLKRSLSPPPAGLKADKLGATEEAITALLQQDATARTAIVARTQSVIGQARDENPLFKKVD